MGDEERRDYFHEGETGSYNLTGHDAMPWIDRGIPDDPHLVFINSYEQPMSIIVDHCSEDGSNLINRMVFGQASFGDNRGSLATSKSSLIRSTCQFYADPQINPSKPLC
jgi:hypothetical protein